MALYILERGRPQEDRLVDGGLDLRRGGKEAGYVSERALTIPSVATIMVFIEQNRR